MVIKLGALGDFVQALGPMKAIRDHHRNARITLLTTKPYAAFAQASGYVDEVWTDVRPKVWQVAKMLRLRRQLNGGRFGRVYDLQTSDRSSSYFRLFSPKPEWSGIAAGASHPHTNPGRDRMHTLDRQAEQLKMAGIAAVPAPDLSWADADIARFGLAEPFVLMAPGGAPHRPAKRWPAEYFGELATRLAADGITPVLLGTDAECSILDTVKRLCPAAVDLGGMTDFLDIAALARHARAAVGNDTGPMHLIAAAGCPTVVLFSHDSDPALCAPRGTKVALLRVPSLASLSVDAVFGALEGQ